METSINKSEDQPPQASEGERRDAGNWARPIQKLKVSNLPQGAVNLNLDGRQLTNPLHGFGQLWQKTYRVRLPGVQATPQEVLNTWKENFDKFQPSEIHFHPPLKGLQPGEVMPIDFHLPILPGLPEMIPMASGVTIVYSDESSFTVMTPQGFPISGWNTFSVFEEEDTLIAQVQSLIRSADPVYEFGMRFLGGARKQENDWIQVLTNLAKHYGVNGYVQVYDDLIDPKVQWQAAKNVWHNAAIRTFFYRISTPVRRLAGLFR